MLDSASWLGEGTERTDPSGVLGSSCGSCRSLEVHAVLREAVRDQNGQLSVLASFRLSAADVELAHKFACGSIVGVDVT